MNIAKKIAIILGSLPGFLAVLGTVVSVRFTSGINNEAVSQLYNYSSKFGLSIPIETNTTYLMLTISDNAQLIITIGVIWVVIFAFLWEKNRRKE